MSWRLRGAMGRVGPERRWGLSRAGTEFELVTDEARFLALEPEWDRLWARSAARRFTRSFAWRSTGWRTTGRPRGRRLNVLVMRLDGEAVLIWPLAVRRRLLLWRIAMALGPEYTEYDPVLVAAGPQAADHIRQALAFLRQSRTADVLNVKFVRDDEDVHAALSKDPRRRILHRLPSPYVGLTRFPTWDAYWRTRSRDTRASYMRHVRQLEKYGEVTFTVVESGPEFDDLLAWTLEKKLAWVEENRLDNDFLGTAEFPSFLKAVAENRSAQGGWLTFVLKLDGKPIATQMGVIDERRFEACIVARDPRFAKFSVGTMVSVETLKWLHARGLDCDLRIGHEPYKRSWATNVCETTGCRFRMTWWGEAFVLLTRCLGMLRRGPWRRTGLRGTVVRPSR